MDTYNILPHYIWLCAVWAVGHVGCCVRGGGGDPGGGGWGGVGGGGGGWVPCGGEHIIIFGRYRTHVGVPFLAWRSM